MQQQSIDIYRKFVYGDANMPHPIPARLIALHDEIFALQRFAFHQSLMSNDGHLLAFITWKYHTDEGRRFFWAAEAPLLSGFVESSPVAITTTDPIVVDDDDDDDNDDDTAAAQSPAGIKERLPKGCRVEVCVPGQPDYFAKIKGHGTGPWSAKVRVVPVGSREYRWVRAAHVYVRNAATCATE